MNFQLTIAPRSQVETLLTEGHTGFLQQKQLSSLLARINEWVLLHKIDRAQNPISESALGQDIPTTYHIKEMTESLVVNLTPRSLCLNLMRQSSSRDRMSIANDHAGCIQSTAHEIRSPIVPWVKTYRRHTTSRR